MVYNKIFLTPMGHSSFMLTLWLPTSDWAHCQRRHWGFKAFTGGNIPASNDRLSLCHPASHPILEHGTCGDSPTSITVGYSSCFSMVIKLLKIFTMDLCVLRVTKWRFHGQLGIIKRSKWDSLGQATPFAPYNRLPNQTFSVSNRLEKSTCANTRFRGF